ncbi:hypothetical protein ALC62_13958 [Cyphomyrmex costatus]|uniref:GIY-YIG domain-containing protein n=1 Tax=Cyphomyrmex costatus TaxID=456900 RepID=A0A195C5T1_9HYME|nr:hypothetical protein ALC62_13958 [Cyphomyrmex costatus]
MVSNDRITNENNINYILNEFNNFHPKLKFTFEICHNKLNFLDITIIKNNNYLIYDLYQKPTSSGRYLNFFSQHHHSRKIGVIISLADRILHLSHPNFHQVNFDKIIKILLNNGNPLDLIFNTINKRIHKKLNSHNCTTSISNTIDNSNNVAKINYFTIPYISSLSNKIKNYLNDCQTFKVAYKGINSLNNIIKVQKDKVHTMLHTDVVYKILCKDCDATYVGQTRRTLKTRISEHKNHINRNTQQNSVITNHRLQFSHDFNWDNIKILDKEISLNKRLISEMIHIRKQKNSLNLQTRNFLTKHMIVYFRTFDFHIFNIPS